MLVYSQTFNIYFRLTVVGMDLLHFFKLLQILFSTQCMLQKLHFKENKSRVEEFSIPYTHICKVF